MESRPCLCYHRKRVSWLVMASPAVILVAAAAGTMPVELAEADGGTEVGKDILTEAILKLLDPALNLPALCNADKSGYLVVGPGF